MKWQIILRLFYFLCFIPASVLHAEMREVPFVGVMAASSLTVPLTELARIYSSSYGVTVNVTYDSSLELASEIEKGENTDIFISASPQAIAMLKRKELIDIRTLTEIGRNKLAFIASVGNVLAKAEDSGKTPAQLLSAFSNKSTMVIGDPDGTALGVYTREMLQNVGLWEKIKPISIRADNARNALYLISQGKTVGITYYSDAVSSKEVRIIALLPKKYYSPILYKAVALEGKGKPFATQFIEFLTSPKAKEVLRKSGVEVKE